MGPVQPLSALEEETKAAPARAARRPLVPKRCFSSPPAPNLESPALAPLTSLLGPRLRPSCFLGFFLARPPRSLVLVSARTEGALSSLSPPALDFWVSSPPALDSPPESPHLKRLGWNLRWA